MFSQSWRENVSAVVVDHFPTNCGGTCTVNSSIPSFSEISSSRGISLMLLTPRICRTRLKGIVTPSESSPRSLTDLTV